MPPKAPSPAVPVDANDEEEAEEGERFEAPRKLPMATFEPADRLNPQWRREQSSKPVRRSSFNRRHASDATSAFSRRCRP
jgi:hypothetical protein